MPKVTLDIVGQAYEMPAVQLDAQTCINFYGVFDATGKYPKALLPTPGLTAWSEIVSSQQVRGLFELNNVLYGVIDRSLYKFDHNANSTELGTLDTGVGNVRFVANDSQLFLSDARFGYVYQIVKSESRDAGVFFRITEASSIIGDSVFSGAGLDDMVTGGVYTASNDKTYVVEIDSIASTDTFRWSDDNGNTFVESGVVITVSPQLLNNGVQVTFAHDNSHTLNDKWTFKATVDSAFYTPVIPAYQDGYGVYARQNSKRIYISAINDFSVVNALDFAESNLWPDDLMAIASVKEELWLIGRTTTEILYSVGGSDFPFAPRTNLLIQYGTISPYSVAVAHNNILFWLAENEEGGRVIIMVDQYMPSVISTEAINNELASYTTIDDAIADIYQLNGHLFFWITFPSEDKTWEYDYSTHAWHQRTSTFTNVQPNPAQTKQGRWRVNNHAYFNGKHLFGDFESGKIFELDPNNYTEDSMMIFRERTTKVIVKDLHRLSISSLQLDMQKGVGITAASAQGHDPQVMLQVSRDDGLSWGNEMWRSLGKTGKHKTRAKWNCLGTSDSFVFKFRMTDPVYNTILGGVVEIEDLGE